MRGVGLLHETVQMTQMKVSVPFRNKDAKRFADQFVGEVTEHGLDAVTGEIYMAGPINDDYGIRIFLQEAVELGLARLLNLERGVTEPTGSYIYPGAGCLGF